MANKNFPVTYYYTLKGDILTKGLQKLNNDNKCQQMEEIASFVQKGKNRDVIMLKTIPLPQKTMQ